MRIRPIETLTHSERKVLQVLLSGTKRWKQLQDETRLSRQGLLNAIHSLVKKDMVEQTPRKESGKSYGRTATTYRIQDIAFIKQIFADLDLIGKNRYNRYDHLKALVEKVLEQEKNQYKQYLMLLTLFRSWSNADLKWFQNQVIWGAVSLLGRDFKTFQDLWVFAEQTYKKCIEYLLKVSRKYPVAALALIDSAQDEDISDVLDDYYDIPSLPSRHKILSEAVEPLRQHKLPSFEDLSSEGEKIMSRKSIKPREYPIRTEKQIRKMLDHVTTG